MKAFVLVAMAFFALSAQADLTSFAPVRCSSPGDERVVIIDFASKTATLHIDGRTITLNHVPDLSEESGNIFEFDDGKSWNVLYSPRFGSKKGVGSTGLATRNENVNMWCQPHIVR